MSCQNAFQGRTFLRFLEWQAKARSDGAANTFYDGRYLEQWAPTESVAALGSTQARYDGNDLRRSIVDSLEAFRVVAREVAGAAGLEYPEPAHSWTRSTLDDLLSG